jgi:hypothetical protein
MNIRINVTEGHEIKLNVSGKHSIPGGHRLGISNGGIGFMKCLDYCIFGRLFLKRVFYAQQRLFLKSI